MVFRVGGGGGGGFLSRSGVLGTFCEILNQKIAFFVTRSPIKVSINVAKGAFRKFLGSVSQKRISQKSTKG